MVLYAVLMMVLILMVLVMASYLDVILVLVLGPWF